LKCRGILWELAFVSLSSLVIVVGTAATAESKWRIVPEVRVAGGDESDLVIDPGLTRTVIPGGSFGEITPAIAARRWFGRGGLLDIGTFATLQRFFNSESRYLYAQTLWGDVFKSLGRDLRGRLSVSLDYFDDSERETVRRLGAGGELGLMFVRPGWSAEMWGGGRGRRYPNIDVQDVRGRSSTYTEAAWSGGAVFRASPVERVGLRADGVVQHTNSSDPLFDSVAWTAFASLDLRLVSSWFLTMSGTFQERDFTERAPGEDKDEYWQIGAGLRYTIAPGWTASIRYGYADYTWPDGASQDTERLAIGIHYVWGHRSAPPAPTVDVDALTRASSGAVQQPDREGNVHLRVRADGASRVAVAGDFNGWSPEATPLRPAGDGWWETRVELQAGVYEYVYVIDGKWTTPPEAILTVDDGFGGRNGILEVLPTGL
jgi:hypothetical protein